MTSLGKRLIKSAKEACKIARGEADPNTYRIHTPPQTIFNVTMNRDRVEFDCDGCRYAYTPTQGRLYVGSLGTIMHQSNDGSFELKEGTTVHALTTNAKLLGATVWKLKYKP